MVSSSERFDNYEDLIIIPTRWIPRISKANIDEIEREISVSIIVGRASISYLK